jgi:hypothetical protein
MKDRSNAGQRVLNARGFTRDNGDSLENTIGSTLPDGAQCWVTEQQANYRFLRHSLLHADGTYVVTPIDGKGRWVREPGLCGFALLDGGVLHDDRPSFRSYTKQQLMQFALNGDGRAIYTGTVPRLAALGGSCAPGCGSVLVISITRDNKDAHFFRGSDERVTATAVLRPGDGVSLLVSTAPTVAVLASLEIMLQ